VGLEFVYSMTEDKTILKNRKPKLEGEMLDFGRPGIEALRAT
jgi:hypothetical protein